MTPLRFGHRPWPASVPCTLDQDKHRSWARACPRCAAAVSGTNGGGSTALLACCADSIDPGQPWNGVHYKLSGRVVEGVRPGVDGQFQPRSDAAAQPPGTHAS
ncbi:hypothetical protein FQR65_LT19510 [Abscondita terminalis]|nr:hypothetical protein FQR65_LT19510 [Abscondita terminalis]